MDLVIFMVIWGVLVVVLFDPHQYKRGDEDDDNNS